MKSIKNLSALFLALSMLLAMAATGFAADIPDYTEAFYVNDYAQVISADTEEELCILGYSLSEATGAELVLTTVDFLGGMDIEDYAKKMFNNWQLGDPEKNNGVLLLLVIGEENYWVMQGKGLEDSLSSGKLGSILEEYLEPDFAAEDYDLGALKTYKKLSETICQIYGVAVNEDGTFVIPEPEPVPEPVVESEPFPIGAVILIFVVIVAVIMLVVFIARINNPKPKRLNGPIPPPNPDFGGTTYSYPDINIGGYGGLGRMGRYSDPTRHRTGTFTTTTRRTGGFGSSRTTGSFGGSSGRSSFGGSRGGRIGGGGGSRGGGAGRR